MTGTQRKQYEMLLRVREFGTTYQNALSTSAVAQQLLAAVGTTIDKLTTTDMQKVSASAEADGKRKAQARRALLAVLKTAQRLARVLRAEGHDVPPCKVASMSDQALLTSGRQLAVDAASFAAEFGGHGMTPERITTATTAFEQAVTARTASRAAHVAARARTRSLLTPGLRQVRRLDVIVATELAADPVAQAVWAQARRLQAVRGSHGEAETGVSTPVEPVGPTLVDPAAPTGADPSVTRAA
ncbi:MAG TPA: hypothetical protein VL173_01660 [Vicinamibacterales bacterium]|nr:hypothetical protein [Vicinamibacterales bacterium]